MDKEKVIDLGSDEENTKSNDQEKNQTFGNLEESSDENLYGKIVYNEQEAYDLYNKYGANIGFSIRRKQKRYDKYGVVRQLNFVCSKEGFREDSDPCKEKVIDRLETRTRCKARIRFSLEGDVWKVSTFNPDHNHKLARPDERQFLRSNRKISESHKGVIKTMVSAGIRTSNTYSYLAEEVCGSQNVGFTKTDCYNFVSREKMNLLEAGDAQSLINLFKHKQVEDPMFFYTVQVDQENRMTNFFWRDGRSRLDYECFGDVIVFDTTYRTNRYNMICGPFVGVNHHWHNVLFGCAFLLDEKIPTFRWLFETFLESMGNRKPVTIYTDQCHAMANAISTVFLGTCHRLCTWHISRNATLKLASYYAIPEFKRLFNKCLEGGETESEFEYTWNEMISKFDLADNTWLKTLYQLREKWCPVFSLDTFTVRIKASQRSESMNNVFHHMCTKTMRLTEFVHHYDKQTNGMRSRELEETFRCNQGLPSRAAKKSGLLLHAANVYTRNFFKLFETEVIDSLAVRIRQTGSDGTLQTFELNEEGRKRVHVVQFNSLNFNVLCSCKMFESMGLLCRHALRVLNVKEVTEIPSQYILKRWTKEAKKGWDANEHRESLQVSDKSSVTLRRNSLMRMAYDILSKGAETDNTHRIAMQKLKEMEELIEKYMLKSKSVGTSNEESNGVLNDNTLVDTHRVSSSYDETPVLDPSCVRPKGISNARLKPSFEKRKKKTSLSKKIKQPRKGGSSQTSLHAPNYLSMTMPTTNGRFPSSNQDSNFSWSFSQQNVSFTNMLQDQNYLAHLNQDFFSTGFEQHQDPKE